MPLAAPVITATLFSGVMGVILKKGFGRRLRGDHQEAREQRSGRADPQGCSAGSCTGGCCREQKPAKNGARLAHCTDEGCAGGTAADGVALGHEVLDSGVRSYQEEQS